MLLQKSERKLDCKALSKQRTSSCSLSLLWRRESWPIQWRSSDTKPKRSIEALSTSSTRKGCLKWKRNDHQIPIKYAYKWAINSNKLVSEGRTIVNNISLLGYLLFMGEFAHMGKEQYLWYKIRIFFKWKKMRVLNKSSSVPIMSHRVPDTASSAKPRKRRLQEL